MWFRFVKLFAFLLFSLLVFSCVSQAQYNEFYQGLLISDNEAERIRLFEKALLAPNEYIRRAAAEELAVLMSQGTELSRKAQENVRREAFGFWAVAFDVSSAPDRKKALSFLLGQEQNSVSYREARLYVLRECEKQDNFFTENEAAAIDGHHAVFGLRYNDALNFFRAFQTDGVWPEQIPDLFIEYPVLVNDLGRAFLFTQSGSEGLSLFLQWDENLPKNAVSDTDPFADIRYSLLFYAARITRRVGGQNAQSALLFERAMKYAPNGEQLDACIWYVLDITITGQSVNFIRRLEQYVPDWNRGSYYDNILERFLHKLVSGREWNNVIRTFNLIKDTGASASKISYAWVIARTIEYSYLSAADMRLAAQVLNTESIDALAYYRFAYDTGVVFAILSFYYRSLSADALDQPFLELTNESVSGNNSFESSGQSQALQFILGFFSNGAAGLSVPYIRSMERDLAPDELRAVSYALNAEGMIPQSMRIASLYIFLDGYRNDRRNWELMFPQPFLELTEMYAQEFNITPSLLFGLIRTESAFQSAVVSRAGAVGLMQLMPNTAIDVADRLRRAGGPNYNDPDNGIDSTDPSLNIHMGCFYFNLLRERLDDTMLALMAYNGGQNRVRRWRNASRLPIDLFVETVAIYETRDYGKRVLGAARIYEELYYR